MGAAIRPFSVTSFRDSTIDFAGSSKGLNYFFLGLNKTARIIKHAIPHSSFGSLAEKSLAALDLTSFPNTVYFAGMAVKDQGMDRASYSCAALESLCGGLSFVIETFFTSKTKYCQSIGFCGDLSGVFGDTIECIQAYKEKNEAQQNLVGLNQGTLAFKIYNEKQKANTADIVLKAISALCGVSSIFFYVLGVTLIPPLALLITSLAVLSFSTIKHLYVEMGTEKTIQRIEKDRISNLDTSTLVANYGQVVLV